MAERTEVAQESGESLDVPTSQAPVEGLPPRSRRAAVMRKSAASTEAYAGQTSTAPAAADASSKPAATPGPGTRGTGKKPPKHTWRDTRIGRVLELFAYLVMLVLVLVYFTGKGLFIYEGF